LLDLQVFQIGNVAIAAVPAQMTVMAGRRIALTINDGMQQAKLLSSPSWTVIVSGLANSFGTILTTPEEYGFSSYVFLFMCICLFMNWWVETNKKCP
jgi:neutral ceramidase